MILVNDKGERKATGSFYTPDYIVAYIVAADARRRSWTNARPALCGGHGRVAALPPQAPAHDERGRNRLAAPGAGQHAEHAAREAFLGIKVCDTAMGSGHFLVNAVDFITDGVIEQHAALPRRTPGRALGVEPPPAADRTGAPGTSSGELARAGHRRGRGAAGRHRAADAAGDEALHLRRGPEPHGGGAGQAEPLAPLLHRRRAAQLPGPSPALGQLAGRRGRAHGGGGDPADRERAVRPLCRPLRRAAGPDRRHDPDRRAGRLDAGRRAPERARASPTSRPR